MQLRLIEDEPKIAAFIQKGLNEANTQPWNVNEAIETIIPAFDVLLEDLKPNKVVVFSKRMFNYWLPPEDKNSLKTIEVKNKKAEFCSYTKNNHKTFVIGVNHASRMFGNSCLEWSPLIKKFINDTY